MKKYLPSFAAVILTLVGVWYFGMRENAPETTTESSTQPSTQPSTETSNKTADSDDFQPLNSGSDGDDFQGDVEMPESKPASQLYKTAEEALAAARSGAKEYDDLVLEQFSNLGEDCTWCPAFYSSLKDIVFAPETSKEERSYLAEMLASSGRMENIQALVDGIKNSTDPNMTDALAAALELTLAKNRDDIVNYLGSQLTSNNDRLKEAAVAAITNQGSELAAKILYDHTVETGDPNGYYSLGMGLGEFVPDENTMPYLSELASKRDAYSHLAVKSLLNAGLPGLKMVFNILKTSPDSDFDRKMLDGAVDHVSFEDGVEEYIQREIAASPKPVVKEFGEQILKELAGAEQAANQFGAEPTPPMSIAP